MQQVILTRGKIAEMRDTLTETDRLSYLDALGIDVWRSRDTEEESAAAEADMVEVPLETWEHIRAAVSNCQKCDLHQTRTKTVFGVGSEMADWMIVGEAPGAEEDRRGEPFVGRAGKLLDEMLRAVGLDRQTVFIANVLKCRPPDNRDPKTNESSQCRVYLDRQIELIQPKIIIAVGRIAAQLLLDTDAPLGRLRGQLHHIGAARTPVVATYHPAYLLRSPTQKRKAWQDLCMARALVRKQAA